MGPKKAIIAGVVIFVLSSFFSAASYCGEEFPEWVPKGAVEKAKEILVANKKAADWRFSMKIEDLKRCELRHPCELVWIHYLDHEAGDNIREAFKRDKYYGFGVYLDNKWLASVGVEFKDDHWEYLNSAKVSKEFCNEDPLGEIYNKYPVSNKIKMYKPHFGGLHYFVEKDGEIIKVVISRPYKTTLYLEPEHHMLEEKERIESNRETLERIKTN